MICLIYNFDYQKDFIICVGDNGSGKTSLTQKFWLRNVPKDKVFVLNSSRETTWAQYCEQANIIKPYMFTKKWFEEFLVRFVTEHSNCLLVLDDIDNYNVKESNVLKSVVINARHMNIGIIATSRNMQALPIIFYRQAKYSCFGRQVSKYDRIYIGYYMDELASQLEYLQEYSFLIYDGKSRQYNIVKLKI